MRAITYPRFGGPDVLECNDIPTPFTPKDLLLVQVKATALNRADCLQRQGLYPPPPDESSILGLEIAGEIIQVGSAITGFQVGDKVFGLVGSGGYAEFALLHPSLAIPIPPTLTFEQAAAIPEAFLTAQEALFSLGNLQKEEAVLIHAGASGVGSAAIQLAKHVGARVFTTVGSPEKADAMKKLGVDHIIDYKKFDFKKIIDTLNGVDLIIDFIGANYFHRNLDILKNQGRLICVGLLGGRKTDIDLSTLLSKRLQIKGLTMRAQSLTAKARMTQQFKEQWLPLFAEKIISPLISTILPFTDVQKAHRLMENNENIGKIILTMI